MMAGRDFQYDDRITLIYSLYNLETLGAADFFGTKMRPIGLDRRAKPQLQTLKTFDFTYLFFFIADTILRDAKKGFYSQNLSMFTSLILSVCFETIDGHVDTSIFPFCGVWRV